MFNSTDSLTSSADQKKQKEVKYCYGVIPARYVFVCLAFFGFVLAYGHKVVLSVAIVSMVRKENATKEDMYRADTCMRNDSSDDSNYKKGDFSDWDDHTQAILLGGFFYGYVLTQLPGGILSEKYGAKWIFGGAIFIASFLSLLAPIAAQKSYTYFIVIRIGQGLAEGVLFPCTAAMVARWMPKMERSRGSTIIYTGAQIGTVITLPLAGVLCDGTFLGGWPAIFYVLGFAGCVWFVLWAIFVYENPDSHPFISQQEYDYIISNQGDEKTSVRSATPWKKILTSVPVYALIITHFGQNWGFLTVLTLLPTYFEKNATMSSLPYLLQAIIGWIASYISDKVRQKGIVGINVIRKVNNTIGFVGPAACLCAMALVKCDTTLSILFVILAMGLNGCVFPGFNSTHVDMAPDFAGTLMGMTNSIGNIPGFVAPLVAAAFYANGHTITNWSYVFYLSAAVFVFSAIVYAVLASAQLQSWGVSKTDETMRLNQTKQNVYTVNKITD